MPLAMAIELISLCQYLFRGTEVECNAEKPHICNANDILNVSAENRRIAHGSSGRCTVLKPGSSISNINLTAPASWGNTIVGHTCLRGCITHKLASLPSFYGLFSVPLKTAGSSQGWDMGGGPVPGAGGVACKVSGLWRMPQPELK